MLLADDVECLIAERDICVGTQNQYRRSVRCYSSFLREPATRVHLDEQMINRWLLSIAASMQPETVRGRKAGLTAVWNYLAETSDVRAFNSNRLRKIKCPEKPPQAWSVSNVRSLLSGANDVRGRLACGLDASVMLRAFVWLAYESGLRPGDIRIMTASSIGDRCVSITQHKTGKPHTFELSVEARRAIEPLLQLGRDAVFGLPKTTLWRWERKLFAAAEKHGFARAKGQGLGTLRKTHATEVCKRGGIEEAARSLGHVSGTLVARQHYIQPDAFGPLPKPPLLMEFTTHGHDTDHRGSDRGRGSDQRERSGSDGATREDKTEVA